MHGTTSLEAYTPCMRTHDRSSSRALLIAVLSVAVAGVVARTALAQQPTGTEAFRWLDVNGDPLPFQDDAAIREALRSATLFSRDVPSRPGLDDFEMLVLEHQGARFYALFRGGDEPAKLEIAASEIDRALGLHIVPPVVERSIGDERGAVQIWRQRAGTELEVAEGGKLIPPEPREYSQQRQTMYLLDNLIANPGRSTESIVIDPGWKIWLIEHVGAFQQTTELLYQTELMKCDRSVWQRLRELDKDALQQLTAPYLDPKQISALVARHRKLVRHIQQMVATFGEDVVLFDGAK